MRERIRSDSGNENREGSNYGSQIEINCTTNRGEE